MLETVRAQSCPKPGEVINEDHYRIDGLLAVADGAGGAGIFSGEWSEYLLKNLPEQPIQDQNGLSEWLERIWELFFEEHEKLNLEADIRNKFLNEGSLSTLSAVWTVQKEDDSVSLHWLSYGDSVILIIDPEKGIIENSISDMRVFAEPPNLLNWNTEPIKGAMIHANTSVMKGMSVLLCTDALGQYLLLTNALAGESAENAGQLDAIRQMPFRLANLLEQIERSGIVKENWVEQVLNPLVAAAENESNFKTHMYDLLNRGLIAPDDYTFVFAKLL